MNIDMFQPDYSDAPPITRLPRPGNELSIAAHTGWSDTKNKLLDGVRHGKMVVLVGPSGVGKTTLLTSLEQDLVSSGRRVQRIDAPEQRPVKRSGVVIVDDAQTFPASALTALSKNPDGCVVAGTDALNRLRDQLPRHTVWVEMACLNQAAMHGYVVNALRRTGKGAYTFSDAALTSLHRQTTGLPRALDALIDMAVFIAALEKDVLVTPEHVERAASLGDASTEEPNPDEPSFEVSGRWPISSPDLVPAETMRRFGPVARTIAGLAIGAIVLLVATTWDREDPSGVKRLLGAAAPYVPQLVAQDATDSTPPVSEPPVSEPLVSEPSADPRASTKRAAKVDVPKPVDPPGSPAATRSADATARKTTEGMPARGAETSDEVAKYSVVRPDSVLPPIPTPPASEKAAPTQATQPSPAASPSQPAEAAAAPVGKQHDDSGLIFLARAGDTMAGLYARVYRGVRPPPYDVVVAMNDTPIKPGKILVFPAPPGGWAYADR